MSEKDIRDKAYLNHKDILDLNFIRILVKEVKAIEKKFHESMEGSMYYSPSLRFAMCTPQHKLLPCRTSKSALKM
ncbi:MAG: hypothetical protein JRE64_23730 [Deltaproteobacteria bacterium]|nr:hypothetical protein [Deltaproteobacteria bacterium]